jgi:naphthoate synthase/2-ketocyclohexanecarboxyl-CoA hydrolase
MAFGPWEPVAGFDFKDTLYDKRYHTEHGGGVARITINRPSRLNATTDVTMAEMRAAFDDASHDRMIGVVVLTGAGDRAFSSGGDVSWEAQENYRLVFNSGTAMQKMLRLCRKPVMAVVRGYAIGGGHHLAYFCDFTIAADNAIFGQNGPRIGSPADGYYVAYLTRVVGAKKAREMWMLCRRYNAQQALEMGLANVVVPLDKVDEEVDKWCEEILSISPTCIEILKATFDADTGTIEGAVGAQAVWSNLMYPDFFDGPEVKEAQQAFFEKRPPNFWQFRKPKSVGR